MELTQQEKDFIEFWHNEGSMPDFVYYQLNGKSPFQNYLEQKRKMQDKFEQRKKLENLENMVQAEVEKELQPTLEKALGQILKTLK